MVDDKEAVVTGYVPAGLSMARLLSRQQRVLPRTEEGVAITRQHGTWGAVA